MSDEYKAYAATPALTLEQYITDVTIPKGEAEWWAHHEILRLRDALAAEKALTKACERVNNRNDELIGEVRMLRAAMHDIYEVYAGSEGIPRPVTCSEVYLYQLVSEMAQIAAKHKRLAELKETEND